MATHAKMLFAEGWAKLDDVVPKELVNQAQELFAKKYIRPELGESAPDPEQFDFPCSWVGDKRHMITIRAEGAFADPALYANPAVIETSCPRPDSSVG